MTLTRRLILQKARHHPTPHKEAKALTACKHTVSGTLSLPSRGTFHLSLTVLVRYRSLGSIQAYQVVLADSHEIPRAPCYSGIRHTRQTAVSSTGLTPSTAHHSTMIRLPPRTHAPRSTALRTTHPTTPLMQPLPGITHQRFSLIRFRSPLLTESQLFSLPAGTEMFHFPAFPPTPYEFRCRSPPSQMTGFPHSDILGSQLVYQLPEAYRRLPRPSSAPNAKASTVRP